MTETHKIQNGISKRIIHYRIELLPKKISSSFTIGKFVCCIFPDFADNYGILIFSLNSLSQIVKKNIRQFISNIKSPACYTAPEPFTKNTIPAADILTVAFILLNNLWKQFYTPPGMIIIRIINKFIPTEIRAFLAIVSSEIFVMTVHIEIFAVTACMAEYTIKNYGYTILILSCFAKGFKVILAAEKAVNFFIVSSIISVI